jgi:hypothetical protein
MEYHAFGIISEGRKATCHYMICGVQGDFTKALVADPPKTLWTRELKFGMVFHFQYGFSPVANVHQPALVMLRPCSSEGSEFAQELALEQHCPHAFKVLIGM